MNEILGFVAKNYGSDVIFLLLATIGYFKISGAIDFLKLEMDNHKKENDEYRIARERTESNLFNRIKEVEGSVKYLAGRLNGGD